MSDFSPGDIIVANVPNDEDPTHFKVRPSMVISKLDEHHYSIAKITKTNRVGELKGEWIDKNSKEFISMGLTFPSFIRLENIISIPKSLIRGSRIGVYPDIENLLRIHKLK